MIHFELQNLLQDAKIEKEKKEKKERLEWQIASFIFKEEVPSGNLNDYYMQLLDGRRNMHFLKNLYFYELVYFGKRFNGKPLIPFIDWWQDRENLSLYL
jgi:hypothetical protein